MDAICDLCKREYDFPDRLVRRLTVPPDGARRFVSHGCDLCLQGKTGTGWFWWELEDGSTRSAIAGEDDLRERGVTTDIVRTVQ